MPIFKCTNCRATFFWQPSWGWIRKNYVYMVERGTADPGIEDDPIIRHPRHLHPACPRCGGSANWLLDMLTARERSLGERLLSRRPGIV